MEEITISSMTDFIGLVLKNEGQAFLNSIADLRLTFRGQANENWDLLPAVFRTREDFLNESLYIREFEREVPEECHGLSSMELLKKAQHFGIPTRLLDLTLNPLMALYFACASEFEAKGAVYVSNASLFREDELLCLIVTEYVCKYKDGRHWWSKNEEALFRSLDSLNRRNVPYKRELLLRYLEGEATPTCIMPRYTNSRLRAQRGAFLLGTTPLVSGDDPGYGDKHFCFPDECEVLNKECFSTKIIIPSGLKERLLAELDCMGINEATLFPDLEHIAHSVVDRTKRLRALINKFSMEK